jgi:hypothetical protein
LHLSGATLRAVVAALLTGTPPAAAKISTPTVCVEVEVDVQEKKVPRLVPPSFSTPEHEQGDSERAGDAAHGRILLAVNCGPQAAE